MKSIYISGIVLLVITGALALLGGIPMILDPSGGLNQLPVAWLKASPLPNYLIPGLFLSLAIGVFSLLTALASLLHYRKYPYMTMAAGGILIVWISVQLLIIPVFSLLQPLFMLIGACLLLLGVLQIRPSTHG
ncbi:hypothetical protein [Cesiribacter andamanensis]|uniref:Uncharacterized protein n=1 Tax=Cesiribacter andamanensis AMV16 TaxID=1279009 RepID=M7NU02_9BACT|nr:hypothetical protein [Cesiribacter andamanensis]EMR01964.1 hypothetical protein ADICEAN_02899 [Cesiribacter andamanensis AMV16]